MRESVINKIVLPAFILYQVYFPFAFIGIHYMKSASNDPTIESKHTHYSSSAYSLKTPVVTLDEEGIVISKANHKLTEKIERKEGENIKKKTFKEIDLQLFQLEEEVHFSGGTPKEFSQFALQLEQLSGTILIGSKM